MVQQDYMLALVPRMAGTSIFGAIQASIVSLVPNPKNQPRRIYALLATGGGVIHREDVAQALAGAGFTVTKFKPSSEEKAYLVQQNKAFAKAGSMWAVSCDKGPVFLTEQGRRCGPPPGLVAIDEAKALSMEMATQNDLQEPYRHVDPRAITGYVFYGMKAGELPTPALLLRAIDTVRRLEAVRAHIDALQARQRQSGIPMAPPVEARIARAARTLATFAQPVAELRRGYGPLRDKLVAAGAPGADKLPTDPFPRFGEPVTLSASTIGAIALVAVIVVAASAAVIVLAYSWTQVVAAQTELDKADVEQRDQLMSCVQDSSKNYMQRLHCKRALHEITVQSKERRKRAEDANPFGDLADAMKYAVPLATIGFIGVYFGPAISEGMSSVTAALKSRRQLAQKG